MIIPYSAILPADYARWVSPGPSTAIRALPHDRERRGLYKPEAVAIPEDYAAEMVPFNPLVGEFRVHYAGFFDPGFGLEKNPPPAARAVLEVRSHEVPFIFEHGQTIGRLVCERLTGPPPQSYGRGIGLSYQRQGLKLSKHLRGG